MHNNYPRARVWLKSGPYRDIEKVAELCDEEKADVLWIDGKEGGTGLSPIAALKDLGLPLVACLRKVALLAQRLTVDFVCSGRVVDGGDVVKVLCFRAAAAGLGRPVVVAAYRNGVQGVRNYFEALRMEVQMLTSAVGKYRVSELGLEDVYAINTQLARDLGIASIYD
ncbi:MAG: glutamate synthase-related protein, partial [Candidatus Caldarchaeum sp.]